MKTKILVSACLISQMLWAQKTNKRSVSDFNGIVVNVSSTVVLEKASSPYVIIETKDSEKENLKTEVVNGKLVLKPERKDDEVPEKITIGYVDINNIEANYASSIKVNGVLNAPNMLIDASGASTCKAEIESKSATFKLSGASSLKINGHCDKLTSEVSGASSLKAEDFVVKNADVEASGASVAKVNVSEQLTASASGASSLKYKGNPKDTKFDSSGASHIRKIDTENSK